jgi:hypothetical protein
VSAFGAHLLPILFFKQKTQYMKKLLLLLFVCFLIIPQALEAQKERKLQKKYLPKELYKKKLYFGQTKEGLLKKFPNATLESSSYDFREVYLLGPLSNRFEEVVCYVDTEGDLPVYEFILMVPEGQSNTDIGRQLLGPPNHEEEEWRFSPSETGLPYTIAAWTYQNKLILAAAMAGTEWEPGFN